jgi:hypothetical protein
LLFAGSLHFALLVQGADAAGAGSEGQSQASTARRHSRATSDNGSDGGFSDAGQSVVSGEGSRSGGLQLSGQLSFKVVYGKCNICRLLYWQEEAVAHFIIAMYSWQKAGNVLGCPMQFPTAMLYASCDKPVVTVCRGVEHFQWHVALAQPHIP